MNKLNRLDRRKLRVRSKLQKTSERPRLTVNRTNQHIYAQIVDDTTGNVLVACSDSSLKLKERGVIAAEMVGEEIAKRAKKNKITQVVYDRSGYQYHGRVKALAEGARKGGLEL